MTCQSAATNLPGNPIIGLLRKGAACILKTQIKEYDTLTACCRQYDEKPWGHKGPFSGTENQVLISGESNRLIPAYTQSI